MSPFVPNLRYVLAVAVALAACKPHGLSHRHVDKLEFKTFTITVPAGWDDVTDPVILDEAPPGSHVLARPTVDPVFNAMIVVLETTPGAAESRLTTGASDDSCRDQFLMPFARGTHTVPDAAKSVGFHGFKGCEMLMHYAATAQAALSFTLSDGMTGVSLTCNRNKAGAPEVDAACEAIASSITPK